MQSHQLIAEEAANNMCAQSIGASHAYTPPLSKGYLGQKSPMVHWLAACGLALNMIMLLSHDCVSACNGYDNKTNTRQNSMPSG